MHECDPVKRREQGKQCESKENIHKFFEENIMDLDILTTKPSLTDYESQKPITTFHESIDYTTKPDDGLVHA